jgi:hypothetical protein
MEEISSYLISASWFFLMSWLVLLLVACAVAFRQDAP